MGKRMMLAGLLVFSTLAIGLALFPKEKNNLAWAVPSGSVFAAATLFVVSTALGLNPVSLTLSSALLLAAAMTLHRRNAIRLSLEKDARAVALAGLMFFSLAGYALFHVDDVPRGVRIDFGFHASIASNLAENGNVPLEHPLFSGAPLHYYYLPHLFSAALSVGGLDLPWALAIPFALWNAALVAGIFLLAEQWFSNKSAAILAVFLFLLNGSFAFVPYLQSHDVLSNFGAFVQDPGFLSDYRFTGFPFENNLVAQLFFTRSFPLGFGLLVLLVYGLKQGWGPKKTGILAGILPLVHLPSFGLWLLFAVPYALFFDRKKHWLTHGLYAGMLATPSLWFLLQGGATQNIRLNAGWMALDATPLGIAMFWLGNIGLFLALAAYAFSKQKPFVKNALVSSIPAFVLGNLVLVAPNAWDNIKLFLLFFLVVALLAADGLARLWKKGIASWAAVVGLVVLMTFTGVLHAATVFAHTSDEIYPANDWNACQWVKDNLPQEALLLTDGTHSCVSAIQGFPVFLGPLEWIENHGIPYKDQLRENDAMLTGNCALLKQNGVTHFYRGGYLGRNAYVNTTFWDAQEKIFHAQGVTIYRVSC